MKVPRWLAVTALTVGLAAGGYGIASAASGSGEGTTDAASTNARAAPSAPRGGHRSDETPLTGDALAKVTAAAKAEFPGGKVVRVETDADGHAKYEAHMTDTSGNPVTVYVDADYEVVNVERRP
jgi:hypothetical protein